MDATPVSSLVTPLCKLLGIHCPIIQAPMAGGPTTPELVAAVSNAGGLGMLAASRLTTDQLRTALRAVRALTDRPFGVNFLLAPPEPGNRDVAATQLFLDRFRTELDLPPGPAELVLPSSPLHEQYQLVLDERVPVLSFAMGDPHRLVEPAHAAGARVLAMVTTVADAVRMVDAGVDGVIAQGGEAGGHRSTLEPIADEHLPLVGTLALVPQVVDAVPVPVVAAGGIMDGRGMVAALTLGAAGVQLGTRFLLARESGASPAYQERLLGATEADTVVTRAFTGRPARSVRNRFTDENQQAGAVPLAWPFQGLAADDIYRAARERDEADYVPLLAGQGLRLLRPGQGAGEIVAEMMTQARAVIVRLSDQRSP